MTLHGGSSDSGLSSNSSRCGSDESHLAKHDCDELNDDSGYSSQSGMQTCAHQGRHSGKVHPIVTEKSSNKPTVELDTRKVSTSKDTGVSPLELCETSSAVCNETLENEPEVASNCSSGSKASDVSCVGINSVDLYDVESVNSSHEGLPTQTLHHGVEEESGTPQMLYDLYTISVSTPLVMRR